MANKEKIQEKHNEWLLNNKERTQKTQRQYIENNKEKVRKWIWEWAQKNKEQRQETSRRYRIANKEALKEKGRQYRESNIEQIREYRQCKKYKDSMRKYNKKRHLKPKNRLNNNISRGIGKSIKGDKAGRRWESLVGYTLKQLIRHLEKQFLLGMTWDNYGKWHVDHKIPKDVFNFDDPEHLDFKRCWALKNLQPMWAEENIYKSNQINKPFQPSLTL